MFLSSIRPSDTELSECIYLVPSRSYSRSRFSGQEFQNKKRLSLHTSFIVTTPGPVMVIISTLTLSTRKTSKRMVENVATEVGQRVENRKPISPQNSMAV